jgi:hypothetical protein
LERLLTSPAAPIYGGDSAGDLGSVEPERIARHGPENTREDPERPWRQFVFS